MIENKIHAEAPIPQVLPGEYEQKQKAQSVLFLQIGIKFFEGFFIVIHIIILNIDT